MTVRHPVVRAERVKPTAETLAKSKGCIIRILYEGHIIDGPEQDAALEIVEAFSIMTSALGIRPLMLDEMPGGRQALNERAARLWDHYVKWGQQLVARRHIRPHVIVEWLEMDRQLNHQNETKLLVESLKDWLDLRGDDQSQSTIRERQYKSTGFWLRSWGKEPVDA